MEIKSGKNGKRGVLIHYFITCEHKTQFYTPKIGCKMGNLSWECLNGSLYTLVCKITHLSTLNLNYFFFLPAYFHFSEWNCVLCALVIKNSVSNSCVNEPFVSCCWRTSETSVSLFRTLNLNGSFYTLIAQYSII